MDIVCDGDALVAYIATKVSGQGIGLLTDVRLAMNEYIFIANPWLKEIYDAFKAVLWHFEHISVRIDAAKDRMRNGETDVKEYMYSDEEVLSFENTMSLVDWLYEYNNENKYGDDGINGVYCLCSMVMSIEALYHCFVHERESMKWGK